jgi:hypothetical protein
LKLVAVEGPEEVVRALGDIPDLVLVLGTIAFLDGGRIRVSGYAGELAIPLVEARNATVTTIIDEAELAARFAELDEGIGKEPEPPPVA